MSDLLREFASYPSLARKMMKYKQIITPQKSFYGNNKEQYFLDFVPNEKIKDDKVILYIHGGGWNSGTPNYFKFIGQTFALCGYRCISLGYRKTPKFRYPVLIEDICNGYKKIKEYLLEKGASTDKIVIVGSSAGAHLGALLCYDTKIQQSFGISSEDIIGYAGLGGPYLFSCEHSWMLRYLVKKLFDKEYVWTDAEPYNKIEENIKLPMLLIHSKHDGVVGVQSSQMFYEKAVSLNIPAKLYYVMPNMDTHSAYTAGIFLENREQCQTLNELLNWIESI